MPLKKYYPLNKALMDFRSNRLRNLLLNDDRSRGEVAEILDVCLRHLVPHNHNHYNIYMNNSPSRVTPEEEVPIQSRDITSSINNLVDSIVTEIAQSPVEVNTVPVTVSSRVQPLPPPSTNRIPLNETTRNNTDNLSSVNSNNYEILITDTNTPTDSNSGSDHAGSESNQSDITANSLPGIPPLGSSV